MRDKELREIVYELFYLLQHNNMLYPDRLPPTNSNSLHAKVSRLKKFCEAKF